MGFSIDGVSSGMDLIVAFVSDPESWRRLCAILPHCQCSLADRTQNNQTILDHGTDRKVQIKPLWEIYYFRCFPPYPDCTDGSILHVHL